MEITLTLNSAVLFLIYSLSGYYCQIGEPDSCLKSSSSFDISNNHALFVCTNSPLKTANTVYMDTSDVPKHDSATCYCTVTFESDEQRTITLDYTVLPNSKKLLTIRGFDIEFSSTNIGFRNVSSSSVWNSLEFNIFARNSSTDLSACLMISTTSHAFQAQCFQKGIHPSAPPTEESTKSTETNTISSTIDTSLDDYTSEFPTQDTSRPTTHTTPKEDTSSESNPPLETDTISSTIGSSFDDRTSGFLTQDTSRPTSHTTPKEDNSSESNPPLGTIIGAVVGGSAFLIVVVIVTIVLIKKRKRKSTKDNEDYYITENAMYNASVSTPNHPYVEYDTVNATHANNDSSTYAVVDKNKGNQNFEMSSQPEDEYNHLNEIAPAFSTGNVYSTTGNVYSTTGNVYTSVGKI